MTFLELSDCVLLDRGFIKTIVNLTFENIRDCDFCRDSSYVLSVASESLVYIDRIANFYHTIGEFKLINTLLHIHSSNERICSNVITILIRTILNWKIIEIPEESLKSFFHSDFFDLICSMMEKSKNESFISLCGHMLTRFKERGNSFHTSLLFI